MYDKVHLGSGGVPLHVLSELGYLLSGPAISEKKWMSFGSFCGLFMVSNWFNQDWFSNCWL